MRRAARRAFGLLEMLLALGIVVGVLGLFLYMIDARHRVLVDSSADALVRSFYESRTLAASSYRAASGVGVTKMVFRPRGGPYQSFSKFVDDQVGAPSELQGGVFLVDTNGLMRGDALFIRDDGKLAEDESGALLKAPDPGYLTVVSNQTDQVSTLVIDLATGDIEVR